LRTSQKLAYKNRAFKNNIIPAEIIPLTGSVTSQLRTIFTKIFHLIPSPDLIVPTATTEPTRQWVVEIGRPALEAKIERVIGLIRQNIPNKAVTAAPNSIVNPLKYFNFYNSKKTNLAGLISDIFWPTVLITRCPKTHNPTQVAPTPNNTIRLFPSPA
jgi:Ni,Fe-hydrogenase III small subunit